MKCVNRRDFEPDLEVLLLGSNTCFWCFYFLWREIKFLF